jgi:ureidoacrylate peracid hydrolase
MTPDGCKFQTADALLVIDMQNSFLKPQGAFYDRAGTTMVNVEPTVQRTAEAIALAGAHALPVIYTRHCYRPGYIDAGARTLSRFDLATSKALVSVTWDAALVEDLGAADDAIVVDKTRMDAFVNTDLEVVLRGLGATRLLVAGVLTNACVETTTRSAAMRDIDVTILADCCTTWTADHQAHALTTLQYYGFAAVAPLEDAASQSGAGW